MISEDPGWLLCSNAKTDTRYIIYMVIISEAMNIKESGNIHQSELQWNVVSWGLPNKPSEKNDSYLNRGPSTNLHDPLRRYSV